MRMSFWFENLEFVNAAKKPAGKHAVQVGMSDLLAKLGQFMEDEMAALEVLFQVIRQLVGHELVQPVQLGLTLQNLATAQLNKRDKLLLLERLEVAKQIKVAVFEEFGILKRSQI